MNATTKANSSTLTADDVIREGNVRVILPWDNRVGELWWDAARRLFGLAGLNGERIPRRFLLHASWDCLTQKYAWHDAVIRRAPDGAEPGDLVR